MSLDTARRSACATVGVFCVLLASCGSRSSGPPAAGFAYTAPASTNLIAELALDAATTATLEHGARVEILEVRRRFVRVRTASGAVGWIDSALLLTQTQIDDLTALSKAAAAIPSQGVGTVYDALNVHMAASRSSPNIVQLQEGEKFDVVGHRVTPRTSAPAVKAVVIGKEPSKAATPAPPPPVATGPQPADDWFLVRTSAGRAGWVLMRPVLMQVPDEVAQYAERQLITSYRPLGDAVDGKNHWLWTTLVKGLQPYDFDSFRVFVYNARKERYETTLIERNLKGYFPVETSAAPDGITFSLLVEDKDGQIQKRTYLFKERRARLLSKSPVSLPKPLPEVRPATAFDAVDTGDEGWFKTLRKKWFGP